MRSPSPDSGVEDNTKYIQKMSNGVTKLNKTSTQNNEIMATNTDANVSQCNVSSTIYYAIWLFGIILTVICIQDMYNEHYHHACFRDSIVCQDTQETERAGIYATIYCKRHR